MDKKTLIKILKSEPMTFSLEEVQNIMDEELLKDPEEMDTDLIDICVEVLEKAYSEEAQQKKSGKPKVRTISKVLLIVAIVVIFLTIAITVGANLNQNPVSNKFVQYARDHFAVNLRGGLADEEPASEESVDIVQALQNQGIDSIILPSEVLKFSYSDINIQDTDYLLGVRIKIQDLQSKVKGSLFIDRYDDLIADLAGVEKRQNTDYKVEQFYVNGIDVVLFYKEDRADIEYLDGLTTYMISLYDCDYETAVKIIMSLQ